MGMPITEARSSSGTPTMIATFLVDLLGLKKQGFGQCSKETLVG